MTTSSASVQTAKASTNLKKLCRHFAHKVEVDFDDARGVIRFPFGGEAELLAADDTLRLEARAEEEEALARVEKILTDHLLRFAHREELAVSWHRAN